MFRAALLLLWLVFCAPKAVVWSLGERPRPIPIDIPFAFTRTHDARQSIAATGEATAPRRSSDNRTGHAQEAQAVPSAHMGVAS